MIKEAFYSPFTEEKPARTWIDERGREVLDKTPVAIPLNFGPPPSSILQLIQQLYRDMDPNNHETFADADDFDVSDELGIEMESTPYEQDFDRLAVPAEPAPKPDAVPAEPDKPQEIAS